MNGKFDFAKLLEQSKLFFQNLSLRQKMLLAGGTLLVAVILFVFVQFLGGPTYKTLYSGLNADDSQAITARLAAASIPFQVSRDGTSVLVASEKLDDARLQIATQPMPRSGRLGFELFDKPNWAGSDFSEKVNYQRALEGELERTLATLSEVEAVRVHLVMPQESLFTERQHDAKAAVIIKTRTGHLSEEAQQAIPQLVASAVDRLKPENVTVVDADSNTPLLHGPDAGSRSYRLDEELSKTLVQTLEPVVGADHVRASVHVEYDLGTSEDTQETYDPKSAATLTQEHTEESSTGAAPAGVPGTASNVPSSTPPRTAPVGAEQSSSRSDATTYAVSKSLHHSLEPPGRVHRIAAAVLVDDAVDVSQQAGKQVVTRRKRTPDEMKQIEELAQAAIGVDTQRGDVLAVENLSFQVSPVEAPPPPGKTERVRKVVEPWSWTLRYIALAALFLVIYGLVLRPLKKQALTAFRELPVRLAGQLTAQTAAAGNVAIAGAQEGLIADGGNRASKLKRLLSDKVKAEPEAASRLVQTWVQQEDRK